MKPIISVVLAVYNDETYIEQTIKSVMRQRFNDFEFIIIDDGSTDDTLGIIKYCLKSFSKPYQIIEQSTNKGCPHARNIANNLAQGEYIAVQDGDDISLPRRLDLLYRYFRAYKKVSFIGGGSICIDSKGTPIRFYLPPENHKKIQKQIFLKAHCTSMHPSGMYKKKDFIEIGGYDENLHIVHDLDLFMRFSKANKLMYNIQWPLIKLRLGVNNISSFRENPLGMIWDLDRVIDKHPEFHGKRDRYRQVAPTKFKKKIEQEK